MIKESKSYIPLWVAIAININIVIGCAFFLSAPTLVNSLGIFAPFAWLMCGLILIPLIMVLAQLALTYPRAGGLYVYSTQSLGSFWGFVSGWGYFIGTSAANAAVIHAFSQALQKNMNLGGLYFDGALIIFFALLNF